MDSSRSFIAPGKIVLLGEYAVLDGAPAIVAAVNRGVRCTVSPHPSRLDIDAVNHRFVGPALAAWSDKPGHYRFEPHNPTETASKVGLGSSAAATVAAALAGSSWNNHPLYGDTLFKTAFGIHREVQGSGSGIDVAASVYGGMLQYQQKQITPVPPVQFVVIWSGKSASTGPRIQQYLNWTSRRTFVQATEALVYNFHQDPVGTIHEANGLLHDMARRAQVDYATPALAEIAKIAVRHNGASKPSGAGGGDCAIACFPSETDAAGFLAECNEQGYEEVSVSLSEGAHEAPACRT